VALTRITVSRPVQFVGGLAAFRIELDGIERARLRAGASVTLTVEPGFHEVAVRMRRHRCSIAGESTSGSHIHLIADVDDAELSTYLAASLVRKLRSYRAFMRRARTQAGYLRIRQADA